MVAIATPDCGSRRSVREWLGYAEQWLCGKRLESSAAPRTRDGIAWLVSGSGARERRMRARPPHVVLVVPRAVRRDANVLCVEWRLEDRPGEDRWGCIGVARWVCGFRFERVGS